MCRTDAHTPTGEDPNIQQVAAAVLTQLDYPWAAQVPQHPADLVDAVVLPHRVTGQHQHVGRDLAVQQRVPQAVAHKPSLPQRRTPG
ncbi:hypothetical protein ACGFIW_28750 [Micromonospora sp. NPDC048935]|uniref:hypothetical protein n=1 Tax=Micromonospora sp. NPDC048935 TaxID=3364262 RepID=UPI0037133DEA